MHAVITLMMLEPSYAVPAGMACVDAADEHSAVFAAVKFGQTGSLHCLVQQTGCSLEPRDYR